MPKKKQPKKRDKWVFAVEGETFIARSTTTGHFVKTTPVKVTEELLPRLWLSHYKPSEDERQAALAGFTHKYERKDEDDPGGRSGYAGRFPTREKAIEEARRDALAEVYERNPKPRKWKLVIEGDKFTARPSSPGFDWFDSFTVEETEPEQEGGPRFSVIATFIDHEHPTPGRQIVDRCPTREEALKSARQHADNVVKENNPAPKPKGSFDPDGEPKECRECGQEGEDCYCGREDEDDGEE